jgi:hypothetical protein
LLRNPYNPWRGRQLKLRKKFNRKVKDWQGRRLARAKKQKRKKNEFQFSFFDVFDFAVNLFVVTPSGSSDI